MNRIKKIIEALRVLSHTPSKTISKAAENVMLDSEDDVTPSTASATAEERLLVKNILAAVVDLAKEMEKPAKAQEAN